MKGSHAKFLRRISAFGDLSAKRKKDRMVSSSTCALSIKRLATIESLTFEGGFKQAERQERRVLETGEITQRHERRLFDDAERHTLRITKFPIHNQDGRIVKIGSVSVDLTE